MTTTKKINANGTEISILLQGNENDYICLTDMARYKDKQRTDYIIQNWMRSRSTIEILNSLSKVCPAISATKSYTAWPKSN